MKYLWRIAAIVGFLVAMAGAAQAEALKLSFASAEWTGKSVPKIGICLLHGGDGISPAITVAAIPAGAEKLILKFSDRDWQGEGAHGVVGLTVSSGSTSVTVPAFKGETDALPLGITKISSHLCAPCAGGVYLGPCSGGSGHRYQVTVYAKDASGHTLGEGTLALGKY